MSEEVSPKFEAILQRFLRKKGIVKPLNTGWIDDHVRCLREGGSNVYFYTKNGKTIMIDAGGVYDRLEEKMAWLDLKPSDIQDILLTHVDPDRIGAVEKGKNGPFPHARLWIGEVENQYLTGEKQRKLFKGAYRLPQMNLQSSATLLGDEQVVWICDIKIEALLVRGHTWGHMVYLIDDRYLFTGDTLWLGPEGGSSYVNVLAEDSHLNKCSLKVLKYRLDDRKVQPLILTAHCGWTDDLGFAFAHIGRACNGLRKQKPLDPSAQKDPYDDSGDVEQTARTVRPPKQIEMQKSEA